MPSSIGAYQCCGIVRAFPALHNNLQFHEGSCALESAAAAPQFAIGRHKAPTEVPSTKCQARDQEGRLQHRHGRARQPQDPGGREGAEEGHGNSPRHRPEDGDSQLGV